MYRMTLHLTHQLATYPQNIDCLLDNKWIDRMWLWGRHDRELRERYKAFATLLFEYIIWKFKTLSFSH